MNSRWKKVASPQSDHATWHDPTTYDPLTMGPPYLPERKPAFSTTAKRLAFKVKAEESKLSELQQVLVHLRALGQLFLSYHWQARGLTAFEDHLLFERLYNEVVPNVDKLAEKLMGYSGSMLISPVNPVEQAKAIAYVTERFCFGDVAYPSAETMIVRAFEASNMTLTVIRAVYSDLDMANAFKEMLGMDSLLQNLADLVEGFIYLLQQRKMT